jgi:hypothetical protein
MKPDIAQAYAFLEALEPHGQFLFQTFDDSDAKRGGLARIFEGTLVQHARSLQQLNELGAGIFVMVNAGTVRRNEGVTRVRSYFVDLDGVPVEPLINSALPPDILVESSPGKYHGYWLTHDGPLDQFKQRQRALASRFGGDASVCDLARVMRLPGFYHRKTTDPVMVKLLRSPHAG